MKTLLAGITTLILTIVIWSAYDQVSEPPIAEPQIEAEAMLAPGSGLWPEKPNIPEAVIVPAYTTSQASPSVRRYQVKYGDSFHKILLSLDIPTENANSLAYHIGKQIDLNQFQVGNEYRVRYTEDTEQPAMLTYDLENRKQLVVDFTINEVAIEDKQIDIVVKALQTPIHSSLAKTVLDHEAPENLADKILSVFAWQIDFRHLLKGDYFNVVYEEEWADGKMLDCRNILAIQFIHDGVSYKAYGFDNGNGWEYFNAEGQNMSYAPLVFDQITSLYAQKRFHPTRRSYKAHYGMDFEADLGTPIEALKDGVVTRARYGRANGNNVKIQHSKRLSTQYLHMTRIDSAIQQGDSVTQGQVIGYVGSTGWSSGPHLCLRVWYDGKQRDPLDFDFPRREDITEENEVYYRDVVKSFQDRFMKPI